MYIMLFDDFLVNLRDILKLSDAVLISSALDSCLNDLRLEQKYIASSTVVLPALL